MSYVIGGDAVVDLIRSRGPKGFEAFDREEASLGIFPTQAGAASAILNSAANERGAGDRPPSISNRCRRPRASKVRSLALHRLRQAEGGA
jgi:hypothetical protein